LFDPFRSFGHFCPSSINAQAFCCLIVAALKTRMAGTSPAIRY
jgi:hypothetical protein